MFHSQLAQSILCIYFLDVKAACDQQRYTCLVGLIFLCTNTDTRVGRETPSQMITGANKAISSFGNCPAPYLGPPLDTPLLSNRLATNMRNLVK